MKVRAVVLVDVQNIQETFERQGFEVRYDALKDFILTQFGLDEREVKFLAFVPYRREDERRIRLIDALSFMGFRVIAKPVREHPDGGLKANMDTEIVLEAVNVAPFVEEFILVTGDSDFVPLVDYLSRLGRGFPFWGRAAAPLLWSLSALPTTSTTSTRSPGCSFRGTSPRARELWAAKRGPHPKRASPPPPRGSPGWQSARAPGGGFRE